MTSAPYLDDFLDSLENLPIELNQNFILMRDLDLRTQQLMQNIDKIADNYIVNVKRNSADKNNETLTSIQRQFDTAKAYSDDKVQLSIQTYELVDRQIRKLDSDLARFKADIQFKAEIRDVAINAIRNSKFKMEGSKTAISEPTKTPSVSAVTNPKNPTNSVANVAVNTRFLTDALVGAGVARSTEADMPIDPNEPTFCLCKQVSFGQMIGCDNPDCLIEWFHFACVNLITKPKGKWFCPICITNKKTTNTHF